MQTKAEKIGNLLNDFAKKKARALGSTQVEPEHLLSAMLDDNACLCYLILNELDLIDSLKKEIENFFKNEPHIQSPRYNIGRSERLKSILKNTRKVLPRLGKLAKEEIAGTEYILMAISKEEGSLTSIFFEKNNITDDRYYQVLDKVKKENPHIEENEKDRIEKLSSNLFSPNEELEIDKAENMALPFLLGLLKVGMEGGAAAVLGTVNPNEKKTNKEEHKEFMSSLGEDNIKDEVLKDPIEELEKLVNGKSSNSSKERSEKLEEARQAFLNDYGRDLTKLAKENKSDPVIGRDKEINRLIQILSRRTKNNPVLTGEPGVGKTSIVEGLAQKISNGEVPINLINKKIYSLDLTALVAGTKYRGEFEERMTTLMNILKENKNIIVFIDELHTIIGAGGQDNSLNVSNILKPALSRGEVQMIGSTTTKEYTRFIEKDLALERRFQIVQVEEPSNEETENILNGIKGKYEEYHQVIYDDDVIPTIVKLSRRYIPEKVLPDKAIDILDEAGAVKKLQGLGIPKELKELEKNIDNLKKEKALLVEKQEYENAAKVRDKVKALKDKLEGYIQYCQEDYKINRQKVTVEDVEDIISKMTGIPVSRLSISESERIIHMEEELHNTVIGQDNAVSIISGAIRRARAGISSPNHPLGSFVFLGPTGVGKTQLAKALSKYLFGSDNSLIRIDMSDYMEKHTVSRLVGAPPGYVGYDEGGVLTEKVRRHPYSVVLLDEIEKAHPDIFNLLLQVLEEGELSDNLGHIVNFRNTVIIMTSNAGARQITNEGKVGFGIEEGIIPYEEIKSGALCELKKLLSPELINRIDDIIVFDALSKSEVNKILEIQLKELEERLIDKGLKIIISQKAKDYLSEKGYNPSMGARPMKRLLRKDVEDPLAMELLSKNGEKCNTVSIDYENERIVVNITK